MASETSDRTSHTTRTSRWRVGLVGLLATLGCYADLVTKRLAFEHLGPPQFEGPRKVYWIWEGYVGFETSVNMGALAGLGSGHLNLLSAISVVAVIGIIAWVAFGRATQDLWVAIAAGLILAGILGNLYDRLGFWGSRGVRDWILFQYKTFVWPNFNIADSLLVIGAGLLALHSMRKQPAAAETVDARA